MIPVDENEMKEKLKCSLEIAHVRSALAVASVLVAAYVGVMTLFWGSFTFTIILCGLILLPIWVAYGWRYFRVFRKISRYTFRKAVLAQPHTSRFVHAFHFTVVLEGTEKGTVTTKTSSIFLARGWLGPHLENYLDKEVTLAWNAETGQVVVIG